MRWSWKLIQAAPREGDKKLKVYEADSGAFINAACSHIRAYGKRGCSRRTHAFCAWGEKTAREKREKESRTLNVKGQETPEVQSASEIRNWHSGFAVRDAFPHNVGAGSNNHGKDHW